MFIKQLYMLNHLLKNNKKGKKETDTKLPNRKKGKKETDTKLSVLFLNYLLSLKISFAAPKLLKALVASKGINTLLASPLAISSRASRDLI